MKVLTIVRSCALFVLLVANAFTPTPAHAQSAEEIAKTLQDPLASISALMTDNTIAFNTGEPEETTGYNFQLQPVYSVAAKTFNFIPRAVIPIIGAPGGANWPGLGEPTPGDEVTWGLGDIMLQSFFNPKGEGAWKWGAGPQFSLKTATDSAVAGPGWGIGVGAVVVGGAGDFSFAFLVNQHWGQDSFSVASLQPGVYYNLPSLPGFSINYNNTIAIDWNAPEGKEWTVPLGLGVSQAFQLGGGHGLDVGLGVYGMVARPEGAPNWQLKIGISWLIPR
jgi:hypothetical protein